MDPVHTGYVLLLCDSTSTTPLEPPCTGMQLHDAPSVKQTLDRTWPNPPVSVEQHHIRTITLEKHRHNSGTAHTAELSVTCRFAGPKLCTNRNLHLEWATKLTCSSIHTQGRKARRSNTCLIPTTHTAHFVRPKPKAQKFSEVPMFGQKYTAPLQELSLTFLISAAVFSFFSSIFSSLLLLSAIFGVGSDRE